MRQRRKITIEIAKALAASKDGECLSDEYINAKSHLKWKCSKGHVWTASYDNVSRGKWCPYCAGRKVEMESMNELAFRNGGKCLVDKFYSVKNKYRWMCAEGHTFEGTYTQVKNGYWCQECKEPSSDTAFLKRLVARNGYSVSSIKKVGKIVFLDLICECGNSWQTRNLDIQSGRWCPNCAGRSHVDIKKLHEIASERGGICLSVHYETAHHKYEWRCKYGHEWSSSYSSISVGSWCPNCAGQTKISIEDLCKLAEERGGRCLSKNYTNARTKYEWECKEGHQWSAAYYSIKRGNWCPHCARLADRKKFTIHDYQKVAKQRGGSFLSKQNLGVLESHEWKCANGHTWYASPSSIMNGGSWCPSCSRHLGERFTRIAFEFYTGKKFLTVRPDWLVTSENNQLTLDGYCEELALAFEHQGEQHYSDKNYYGNSAKEQRKIKFFDSEKKRLCIENKVNLLEVPEVPRLTSLQDLQVLVKAYLTTNGLVPRQGIINFNNAYTQDNRLERLARVAYENGGQLLDQTYFGMRHRYNWKCSQGHVWDQTADTVVMSGTWCPYCSGRRSITIDWLRSYALSKGGSLLTKNYKNNSQQIHAICAEGHEFRISAKAMRKGSWCQICR